MTVEIPLNDIPFPPRTLADGEAAAAVLSKRFVGSPPVRAEAVGTEVRLTFPDAGFAEGDVTPSFADRLSNDRIGWEEWERGVGNVLASVANWQTNVGALLRRCEEWAAKLAPPATTGTRRVPFFDQFEEPAVSAARYTMPGLNIYAEDRVMSVLPTSRQVIGGGSRVDLKGGDGPFILVHYPGADTDEWHWYQDQPPYSVLPLDEQQFLELARACLYLGEYALQPA